MYILEGKLDSHSFVLFCKSVRVDVVDGAGAASQYYSGSTNSFCGFVILGTKQIVRWINKW
jgi:hypothetical protein